MTSITLGTDNTVNLDVPKGASGRQTVQSVVRQLGLMPEPGGATQVRTDETDESAIPSEPDTTQQTSTEEATSSGDVPQPAQLDLEAHKDELVQVKIDGELVTKRLGDVVGGYMRLADYTRKTQELAEQRRRVEQGISGQGQQLLELGKAVASNPQARQVVEQVLEQANEPPDEATRISNIEAQLAEQQRLKYATEQIDLLLKQHPEAEDHLSDVINEMRRTGSKDPTSTWRAMDYANVPERLVDAAEAERLKRAQAAQEQSVVNEPSGAASGVEKSSELPTRDSNGNPLTGRAFIKNFMQNLGAVA